MITTVTLNPALDEAVALDELVPGAINRCDLDALDPGGKGINASRVARRLGRATLAMGFAGGPTGEMLRADLDAEGVPHDFVTVAEPTRLNVMIYERGSGRRSRLYLPGPHVDAAALAALRERLLAVPRATVVVGGSLPPGLAAETYRELVAALVARGARTIVDAAGAALRAALAAGPALVKPNVEEASELLGRALDGDDDVLAAALELRARGARYAVVSQGGDGAIGAGPDGCWKALPPPVLARSTVGSGDSMVAGLAIALDEGRGLDDGLRLGTACGAATAMTAGTHLCRAEDVERLLPRVRIVPIAARSSSRPPQTASAT